MHRCDTYGGDEPYGSGWEQVTEHTFEYIHSGYGFVWARNNTYHVFRRHVSSEFPTGYEWELVNDVRFKVMSSLSEDTVWAVMPDHSVCNYTVTGEFSKMTAI